MEMIQTAEKKRLKFVIPPKNAGAAKVSISLKEKQVAYIKRKASQNGSSVSQVIQAAIDVMEELDAEVDKDMQQAE